MKQKSLKKKPFLKFLTVKELEKLNTKRLLGVFNSIRAVESDAKRNKAAYGTCCNYCNDWILSQEEYKQNVTEPTEHLRSYKHRVKTILDKREHIE